MDLHTVALWGRVVLVMLSPMILSALLTRTPRLWRRLRVRLIRWHVLKPPPELASGLPLERLAADLRRLYPDAHFPRKGLRMPKQRGILMAYDKRLADTAAALQVTTNLVELPIVGFDREAERLRVEQALADAGVVWQVRPGPWRADPAA